MISYGDEARQSMLDTLDALRQWSKEIGAVNDRCLPKVFDHMVTAQRAMGWPDHASTTTGPSDIMHYFLLFTVVRDTLQNACKLESEVIDKVAEGCFASRRSDPPRSSRRSPAAARRLVSGSMQVNRLRQEGERSALRRLFARERRALWRQEGCSKSSLIPGERTSAKT
jgi:hypothetical protein